MADIFLSYSSQDIDRIRPLIAVLEKQEWSVWWDRKIRPGKTFDQVIEEEINEAKCVVVVWSTNSVLSEWVKNEAEEGAERGILIPILIDEVKIPFAFRRIHAARFTDLQKIVETQEFVMLCQTIEEAIGRQKREGQIYSDNDGRTEVQTESRAKDAHSQEETQSSDASNDEFSKATKFSSLAIIISDITHTLSRRRILTSLFIATFLASSVTLYLLLAKHKLGKELAEDQSVPTNSLVIPRTDDHSVNANQTSSPLSAARRDLTEVTPATKRLNQKLESSKTTNANSNTNRKPTKNLTQQLEGTKWEFRESIDHRHLYEFLPGGKVRFKCLTTGKTSSDEIWTVVGNKIVLKDRKGEAVREGTLTGNKMRGTGRNDIGGKWTWTATKRT